MLREIKKALDYDIRNFDYLIGRMDRLDSVTMVIAKHIYEGSTAADSLSGQGDLNLFGLRTGVRYQYNRGVYDAIRSSGIDKISNDSLRNKLIELYDVDFPKNMEITQWAARNYEEHIDKLNSFRGSTRIVYENGELRFKRAYREDLFKDQEFIDLLKEISDRARYVRSSFNFMPPKMIQVRDQIDREISKN